MEDESRLVTVNVVGNGSAFFMLRVHFTSLHYTSQLHTKRFPKRPKKRATEEPVCVCVCDSVCVYCVCV